MDEEDDTLYYHFLYERVVIDEIAGWDFANPTMGAYAQFDIDFVSRWYEERSYPWKQLFDFADTFRVQGHICPPIQDQSTYPERGAYITLDLIKIMHDLIS